MKYKTAKKIYNILRYEGHVSLKYLSRKTGISYNCIWEYIQLMFKMEMLSVRPSKFNKRIMMYALNEDYSFIEFLDKVNKHVT